MRTLGALGRALVWLALLGVVLGLWVGAAAVVVLFVMTRW